MADRIDRGDPFNNHYFSLEIDGNDVAHFLECTAFKSASEAFALQEGGNNAGVLKLPGQSKWENLTLKYATSASTELMAWRDTFITDSHIPSGGSARKGSTGALVIRAEDGSELRRFSITGMWPVSWEGPSLSGASSDLGIESLEIAFDAVTLGNPPAITVPEPTPEPPDQFETEPVQFKFDSAELTPAGKETVSELADELEKHPEVQTLWVEGHTCDLGSHAYNQSLSQARSESVAAELKKQRPDRNYIANGYAYDYPVASNNSEANRAKNRRTQFWTSARSGKRSGELTYKSYK